MAGNPFVSLRPETLYRFPDGQIMDWLNRSPGDSRANAIREAIGQYPVARWIGPGSIGRWIQGYMTDAAKLGQLPVFVAFAIMSRDVGQWSKGGAKSVEEYLTWSREFATAIGTRKAVIIVEPDSLMHMPKLTPAQQDLRLKAIRGLITHFRQYAPNATLYLDGGDGRYNSPEFMAPWLIKANVGATRGFFVNVANYNPTSVARTFSASLVTQLRRAGVTADLGYVIDTSRNGRWPSEDFINQNKYSWWCNWLGTKIGEPPRISLTTGAEDALLWIKRAGESDGSCGIAPTSDSGEFLPSLAFRQITGT